MKEMSIRQKQLYDFIGRFAEEKGYAPSYRDISAGCGLGNSTVVAHLLALKRKGYISSVTGIPRTLRILPQSFQFRESH
jgi:repressor LexA